MRRKKLAGRVLAALLSVSMSVSMMPAMALAEDFTDGSEYVLEEAGTDLTDIPEEESAPEENDVTFSDENEAESLFFDGNEAVEDTAEFITEEEGTAEIAAYNAGEYTYITVEKYDSEGNGTFLLTPTAIEYVKKAEPDQMLDRAGIQYIKGYDDYGDIEITGIADKSQEDGYLDNGDAGGTWGIAKNGKKDYWYNVGYYNTSAGTVYRYVYGNAGITSSVSDANSNKNNLIKYIAGLTEEQKEKGGDLYQTALNVILNPSATADEIITAQTSLDDELYKKISAEKLTLDQDELTLNLKDSATIHATLEPADTTDTVTWSSSDESIATVDQNGNVKTHLTPGTVKITAKANDDAMATMTITVTAATSIVLSIEAYEGNDASVGTGRYILEPTEISATGTTYITKLLQTAMGVENVIMDYNDHNAVTGIADSEQSDGFLNNGDAVSNGHWGFVTDGVVVQNGGDGPTPYSTAVPGQIVRVVYSRDGASRISTFFGAANKDELLTIMAGMNSRQKQMDEYEAAKAVALKVQATASEVADAIAVLKSLPENPVPISAREAELRIGETFTLTAVDQLTWRVDDKTIAPITEKNEALVNSYCVIEGKKQGETTVYATDASGHTVSCKVKVVAPVYFEANDGTKKEMSEDGSFTLTSLDEGHFVLNHPKDGETATFECEDKIEVWNPVEKRWDVSFHWWVDDETGIWQPAAAELEKPITVRTSNFSTQFTINYEQVTGISYLKAYIGGKEVTVDSPFEITGTMWTENNYYTGEEVTVTGVNDSNGETITIPSQALTYETDDPNYNFRFVGNKLIINRAGTHTLTISMKQLTGKSDGAPSVSFKAVCHEIPVTGMYVDVDDANDNVCYIDGWDANGEHYVGVRPGSWDGVTGEKLNDGYHITFTPYNTTQCDVKWEVVEGEDVATHSDLHNNGIIPYKAGTVKFKVTNIYNENIYQYVTVTFQYKNPLQAASTAEKTYKMEKGDTKSLEINVTPSNATEQRFNWTYDKEGIVAVTDKIMSSEDGMTSWTVHGIEALEDGVVTRR